MLRLRARVKISVVEVHAITGEKRAKEVAGVLVVKTERSTILGTKICWDILTENGDIVMEVPPEDINEFPWPKPEVTPVDEQVLAELPPAEVPLNE